MNLRAFCTNFRLLKSKFYKYAEIENLKPNFEFQQSLSIAENIFKSNFQSLDVKFQRALILIILRCQNPTFLKASKFFKLKLSTFTSVISVFNLFIKHLFEIFFQIVRTAFSYFTLVRHLYNAEI